MKTVEQYDQIGKPEFEQILEKVMQQVQKNTGIDTARIEEATATVIDDMPHELGRLEAENRSWESTIGYLYVKHLKVLALLELAALGSERPSVPVLAHSAGGC